jgi:hypothetical protein
MQLGGPGTSVHGPANRLIVVAKPRVDSVDDANATEQLRSTAQLEAGVKHATESYAAPWHPLPEKEKSPLLGELLWEKGSWIAPVPGHRCSSQPVPWRMRVRSGASEHTERSVQHESALSSGPPWSVSGHGVASRSMALPSCDPTVARVSRTAGAHVRAAVHSGKRRRRAISQQRGFRDSGQIKGHCSSLCVGGGRGISDYSTDGGIRPGWVNSPTASRKLLSRPSCSSGR